MIPKPYLLFIGDAQDELAIKTASGIYEWRPEWCKAQYTYCLLYTSDAADE